jgi:hypothetical protein
MIAAAQEQFRAQNPYYQAPPAPGEIRDEAFDGEDNDEGGQPGQGQPAQSPQGQQNFGSQQNPNPQGFNNGQQPSYPPREQPQPYGGQQPNSNYQGRPQQQPQQQPYSPPTQQYQPQPPPPSGADGNDVERLPSFITGGQPQPSVQNTAPNGYDNNQGGDRFPRHRRRRHRGPGGPGGSRPDLPNVPQDFRGDEGPEPGNS